MRYKKKTIASTSTTGARGEKSLFSTKSAAAVLAASLITAPVLLSGTANAASDTTPPRYCAVLLGRSASPTQASPVLGESCSETSATEAAAGLGPAAQTVLMTWYADAGWKGTSAAIYGDYGTCDAAGYTFYPNDWWATNMSSIRGDQHCDKVALTSLVGFESDGVSLPWSFGATRWNDSVHRVHVYY
ncbi:hypothetical protein [Actinoallomurus iriomotensis]|uniref:hypothetical protein n=1 Tax=Actinoallomurus iriomotensis TaxID=478107 RepID=UPI002555BD37|nr:hypothetical protein [Actinoallomurus iriomotensis]